MKKDMCSNSHAGTWGGLYGLAFIGAAVYYIG